MKIDKYDKLVAASSESTLEQIATVLTAGTSHLKGNTQILSNFKKLPKNYYTEVIKLLDKYKVTGSAASLWCKSKRKSLPNLMINFYMSDKNPTVTITFSF